MSYTQEDVTYVSDSLIIFLVLACSILWSRILVENSGGADQCERASEA